MDEFLQLTRTLRTHIESRLNGIVGDFYEPITEEVSRLLSREDLNDSQKNDAFLALQLALIAPFLNSAVVAAYLTRVTLGDYLSMTGSAWEQARSELMSRLGEEMLNRAKEDSDGDR